MLTNMIAYITNLYHYVVYKIKYRNKQDDYLTSTVIDVEYRSPSESYKE